MQKPGQNTRRWVKLLACLCWNWYVLSNKQECAAKWSSNAQRNKLVRGRCVILCILGSVQNTNTIQHQSYLSGDGEIITLLKQSLISQHAQNKPQHHMHGLPLDRTFRFRGKPHHSWVGGWSGKVRKLPELPRITLFSPYFQNILFDP